MRHTTVRNAVIDALTAAIGDEASYFDGRPAVFEESDFPAVAVYLTEAHPTGGTLDEDSWNAILHIEVFMAGQVTDSELDIWMENKVYPALECIPALSGQLELMVAQGYDYKRDDDMGAWSSADMTYSVTYNM